MPEGTLDVYQAASLPERMEYAKALSAAGLLPDSYRGQPANVLVAAETGAAMGLHPMQAITGIHVIKGRPVLSASLVGALVRRAGHTLRVWVEDGAAFATVTRCDDPDFTYQTRWDLERARAAGLAKNPTYLAHPLQMLKARATTEVARDACPEVLVGLYSDVEAADFPPVRGESGRGRVVRVRGASEASEAVVEAVVDAVEVGVVDDGSVTGV